MDNTASSDLKTDARAAENRFSHSTTSTVSTQSDPEQARDDSTTDSSVRSSCEQLVTNQAEGHYLNNDFEGGPVLRVSENILPRDESLSIVEKGTANTLQVVERRSMPVSITSTKHQTSVAHSAISGVSEATIVPAMMPYGEQMGAGIHKKAV